MNAFRSLFPSVTQSGCFYHFSQCIYRQVQQHGLQNDYVAEDFSLFIRMLAAIAFIPITDAVDAFDTSLIKICFILHYKYSKHKNYSAEPVVNYFEDNFIGRPDKRGNRRNPVFPLTLWNINQRVVESLPRTNNSVEGWHCGFQSSLQCSHPTLWKLLDQLIWENELHRLTVAQLLAGQTHTVKRVYRITNERIVNVVADYNNHTFAEFLKGIAHNLQL